MKLILHIGTEKTGTTTIQNGLRINETKIEQQGFFIPKTLSGQLGSHNHIKLTTYALEDKKNNDLRKLEGIHNESDINNYRTNVFNLFQNELRNCNKKDTVIISNEHCSSRLVELSEIQRLKSFLANFFDQITILIYLRRQEELFISGYSTAIKSGEHYNLPSVEAFAANKDRYDYYYILNKWASIFGKENIKPYVYDKDKLRGKDIFEDYCYRVGLTNLDKPKKRYNTSLNIPKLEFLKKVNKSISKNPEMNSIRGSIVRALEEISFEGDDIKSLVTEKYLGVYDESNSRVAKDFFGGIDNLFELGAVNNATISNYKFNEEDLYKLIILVCKYIKS